jgi:DNA-binding NarL/FixJ family response regulator
MMQPRRIVIANEQRLLREMLKRIMERMPHLRVSGEVRGWDKLSKAVERTDAHWVIISLEPGGHLPDQVETLLAEHPTVCVLAMTGDAGQVKLKCSNANEENLTDVTLEKLLEVLREESPQQLEVSS